MWSYVPSLPLTCGTCCNNRQGEFLNTAREVTSKDYFIFPFAAGRKAGGGVLGDCEDAEKLTHQEIFAIIKTST